MAVRLTRMPGQERADIFDDKDLPHDMPTNAEIVNDLPEGVATLVGFLERPPQGGLSVSHVTSQTFAIGT